ncbi:MAG: hypothetical protein ABEJ44_06520 [Halanaeroarchaeum sp.]
MHRARTVDERLEAVERALTDEDLSVAAATDEAARESRLRDVETRLDVVEASLDDVEAAVAALRGYVGEIRHVNEEVERTATAAVAAVERLDAASGAPPPIAGVEPPSYADSETAESEPPEVRSADTENDPTDDRGPDGIGESIVDRLRSSL